MKTAPATASKSAPPVDASPPGAEEPVHRFEWMAVAAITVFAALLRLPFLSKYGLWLDELYVRENALEPIVQNLRTVHFIHFLAVKPGLALWDTPFGLRLASACFGIAVVPLAFLAVRRTVGRSAALLFAFFMAGVPYFINYSIDANYYSHMIFWSVAGLGACLRAREMRRPAWLLALVPLGLLAFFVHPFSAVFFAVLVLVSAGQLLTGNFMRREKDSDPTQSHRRVQIAAFGIGVLLCLSLLAGLSGTGAGQEFLRVAERFAGMIQVGESPTNIEFSFDFFENYFRRIGPAYYVLDESLPIERGSRRATTFFLFFVFLAGLWKLGKRPALAVLIWLAFILSFGLIFNLKANRHFNLRYFSPLVPLYWLAIAAAGATVIDRIHAHYPGPGSRTRRILASAAPCLIAVLIFVPQYTHLLTIDGRNWDEVMPVVASRIAPEESIVITNWAEETMLPHYQGLYGARDQPVIKLRHTVHRSKLTEAELRDLCYRTPSLWFLSSWLDIRSEEAVEWAESRLDVVSRGESVFSDRYDVTAYHWNWGGRYVLAPRILDYFPSDADGGPSGFEQSFLFEHSMEYRVELESKRPLAASSASLDHAPLDLLPEQDSENHTAKATRFYTEVKIASGRHTLSITGATPETLERIRIIPLYPDDEIWIEATEASDFYPSDYVWAKDREGEPWLCLKRNTFADYEFGVAEQGVFDLGILGLNSPAGPVWIELRLDEASLGVVQFEKGGDAQEERRFPIALTPGNHTLTARFINEGNVQPVQEEYDRDAWIRGFRIQPVNPAAMEDDRVYLPRNGWIRVGMTDADSAELSPRWSTVTDGDLNPELVPAPIDGEVAWVATMPRGSKGLLLKSPLIPVGPERLAYVSGLVRTENLLNHSANMKIFYFDRAGARLAEKVVNQEGIYRTTDWVRFVEFRPLPEDVGYFQAAFWVYPNGRQPSAAPGRVYFGDLRIETGAEFSESGSEPPAPESAP